MRRLTLMLALLISIGPALAEPELKAPQGEVILTVTGKIAHGNAGKAAEFDLAALEQLGRVALVTHTPWSGETHFEGVPLARVLAAVGAEGEAITATALNDYAVHIPATDADQPGAFLATRIDGQPMRVRDKGPIWIVYPWSGNPALDTPPFHARSIWQLRSLRVE